MPSRGGRGGATGARLVVVLEAVDGKPELVIAQRSGQNAGTEQRTEDGPGRRAHDHVRRARIEALDLLERAEGPDRPGRAEDTAGPQHHAGATS